MVNLPLQMLIAVCIRRPVSEKDHIIISYQLQKNMTIAKDNVVLTMNTAVNI